MADSKLHVFYLSSLSSLLVVDGHCRASVYRARGSGSSSSRMRRRGSHRHSLSEPETSHAQPPLITPPQEEANDWHYFQDSEGESCGSC